MSGPESSGSPPQSPTQAPRSSQSSNNRQRLHTPAHPSQLRQSHVPSQSPEDRRLHSLQTLEDRGEGKSTDQREGESESDQTPGVADEGVQTTLPDDASVLSAGAENQTRGFFDSVFEHTARARLVNAADWDQASGCGDPDHCRHGAFSPRPETHRSYGSFTSEPSALAGSGGRFPAASGDTDESSRLLGDRRRDRKRKTTRLLAAKHGIKNERAMYLAYYIPIVNWIQQYKWSHLRGDLVAAITMASFYIPMALSYADNLGHVPPINGLYSFVFNPFIYAILGTCPQMVVGSEAAGSLLTGQVVRENIQKGETGDDDAKLNAEIAGIVTSFAGAIILLAGLFRLGFLDSVLSRPFLRGFISAIGVVIFVDQLIPEMGLSERASEIGGVAHGSSAEKLIFLFQNAKYAHTLTCIVSFVAFAIIMVFREGKKYLQPRFPGVAYLPDRFIVVVLSAVFAWQFDWESRGVGILGEVKSPDTKLFAIHFPLDLSHLRFASDAFSTAFVIALLGFFESSVAAKSLGTGDSKGLGLKNIHLSANRELVALGVANLTGGMFMALPAFGGYGRSKVNSSTGGRTPMSSMILSVITLFCVLFALPWFYYLPKSVLSAMISVVAYSLLEEAPHDILFFWRIRGWSEILLMVLIFIATVFWNLKIGIAVGIGLSLLRVIRHSTRPRIQILGRVPGTVDQFENAEADPGRLEFIEGCLIVKIPEPLTFANTGDLKSRLRRLEEHGTGEAHPALPRVRKEESNKNIIFDVHGVTSIDGAGTQVLAEIVEGYVERGVRVFFCRIPSKRSKVWKLFVTSGIVEVAGGDRHFVNSVHEALRMSEVVNLTQETGAQEAEENTAAWD